MALTHHHRHPMSTRTITLSDEHWQRISDALLDCCDQGPPGEGWKTPGLSSAVAALDAALAQPEPEGPTFAEIMELAEDFFTFRGNSHGDNFFATDLTAKTDPAQASEAFARAVLQRWGRPAITPIPVSERLPGPKDCAPWPDEPAANHWCWCWLGREDEGCWMWSQASAMGKDADELEWSLAGGGWTHWLPAHALPLPPTT